MILGIAVGFGLLFPPAPFAVLAFQQRPGSEKADDTLVDFTAASALLREIVRQLAEPYIQESTENPLRDILIAPRDIRVRASFQLSRQSGKPSFILVRPTENSMITLEVEASFDVATGKLRVSEAKRILTGTKEEK